MGCPATLRVERTRVQTPAALRPRRTGPRRTVAVRIERRPELAAAANAAIFSSNREANMYIWEEPAPQKLFRNRFRIVIPRSEEHTSELQSLMRISYAVFCLKKKKKSN